MKLPPLPADDETPDTAPNRPAADPPKARGRILVVDDEAGIRGSLARLLGRDHEVVTAASGREAQELLAQDRLFDLVLCDLMMPRMSGIELHAWLSDEDPALARRLVFVTGGAFTPGAAAYLDKVSNLRVEKPFDPKSLKELAIELVRAAKAEGES